MRRSELFLKLLKDIYGDRYTYSEFAKEYQIALRHVRRMANGHREVPDRMFTWLAMRKEYGVAPHDTDTYKWVASELAAAEDLPA